jgi:magnesium chelatase family protein
MYPRAPVRSGLPGKIFGHLFDRIDLHVDVPAVNLLDLSQPPPSEPSKSVAARVAKARALEKDRYQEFSDGKPLRTNAAADGALLEKVAAPDSEGRRLRFEAADRMRLSARLSPGITIARTLAVLKGGGPVARIHIVEAVAYRRIASGKNLVTAKF